MNRLSQRWLGRFQRLVLYWSRGAILPYIWMLIGSVFFALMALLAESVKEYFSFPWITMVRSGVATVLAVSLAVIGGAQLVLWRPATLWARSLSGWSAMIFGFYAMTHYNVAVVLAITNCYPIWVAVLSWPMLGQLPSGKTWLALLASCCGMWLIYSSSYQLAENTGPFSQPQLAIPSAVLASMLSAVALLNLHKLKQLDTRAIVAHFSAVATTGSFLVWCVLPVADDYQPPTTWSILRLVGVGIAATFGQLCLTKAFSSGSPASVSIVGLSQVAVAAIYKWIFEQQAPERMTLVGMALLLAATLSVMVKPETSRQSDAQPTE